MDYIAYDQAHHRVWVPAGNTASVDVVDDSDGEVTRIEGFATAEVERQGAKRTIGPSPAAVGAGVVYVGNRADSTVCAVDAEALRMGACLKLTSTPDGVASVASKTKIPLEGRPEGYAADDSRGLFYTNLEDKDRTVTIDVKSCKVTSTWQPHCGEDGPKGLALDGRSDFLLVACPDHVILLDAGHHGKQLFSLPVGDGIDGIDCVESRHELFAAAGRAAKPAVARLDPAGGLTLLWTADTAPGARIAVATDEGTAYLTDSRRGKILVVAPGSSPDRKAP
jgi:hypothetical protein